MEQWVKDSVLSLQQLGLLLWLEFNLWLGNFCMPWVQPKKKKKKYLEPKDIIKRVKKQPTAWKKVSANHLSYNNVV